MRQVRAPQRPSAHVVRFPPVDQGSAPTPPVDINAILSESGDFLMTESGDNLIQE